MLSEPHRSRYLRALGVDLYVARQPLPGAAPSMPAAWVYDETVDSSSAPREVVKQAVAAAEAISLSVSKPGLRSERPLLPEVALPAQQTAAQSPSAVAVAMPADTPRFSLMVARCDVGIVVIDKGPDSGQRREAYLRLLGNLLFAIYRRPVVVESDLFVWPMVKNRLVDQSEQAARESLGAYLQRQCSLAGGRTLVALGSGPTRWVDEDPSFSLVAGISLWRCLDEGGAKRALWQQLQPLRVSSA
jgi:hypothetical protein